MSCKEGCSCSDSRNTEVSEREREARQRRVGAGGRRPFEVQLHELRALVAEQASLAWGSGATESFGFSSGLVDPEPFLACCASCGTSSCDPYCTSGVGAWLRCVDFRARCKLVDGVVSCKPSPSDASGLTSRTA